MTDRTKKYSPHLRSRARNKGSDSNHIAVVGRFSADSDITDEGDVWSSWEVEWIHWGPDTGLSVPHGSKHLHQVRLQEASIENQYKNKIYLFKNLFSYILFWHVWIILGFKIKEVRHYLIKLLTIRHKTLILPQLLQKSKRCPPKRLSYSKSTHACIPTILFGRT